MDACSNLETYSENFIRHMEINNLASGLVIYLIVPKSCGIKMYVISAS
ncbi:hypothetical protein [Clostridium sp. DL-VIII]|nr:hypothetical protein [Clostridium sp. DL-VIII]